MKKAIFFDRDGIVNRRLIGDYVKNLDEFEFLPEFLDIFKFVKEKGFLAILITNQQGIGKGIMSESDLDIIHDNMQNELKSRLVCNFDDIFFCPELSSANSFRRKPNPGMILEAAKKWNISLSESWFIGDSRSDAKAGKSAGTKTILVGDFSTEEADFIFPNLERLKSEINNLLRA